MRASPRRSSAALGFVALTVLASACVKQGDPRVAVSKLQSNVKFGIEEKPAALPNALIPVEIQAGGELPDFGGLLDFTPPVETPKPCPEAALETFPKASASVLVKGMPQVGSYKFKRSGSVTTTEGTTKSVKKISGFEQHVVRRVVATPGSNHEFSFQIVQPEPLTTDIIVTSYKINTNPQVLFSRVIAGQTIGVVDLPSQEIILTNPADEPGIFLTKIERQNQLGATLASFSPVRPVKYVPLDEALVKSGQTFSSIGIDPRTGEVLTHQGTVLRTSRIDACGEIIEGYTITSTQNFVNVLGNGFSESGMRTYDYTIATQYGGIFIGETSVASAGNAESELSNSIAGLTPGPIPESLK